MFCLQDPSGAGAKRGTRAPSLLGPFAPASCRQPRRQVEARKKVRGRRAAARTQVPRRRAGAAPAPAPASAPPRHLRAVPRVLAPCHHLFGFPSSLPKVNGSLFFFFNRHSEPDLKGEKKKGNFPPYSLFPSLPISTITPPPLRKGAPIWIHKHSHQHLRTYLSCAEQTLKTRMGVRFKPHCQPGKLRHREVAGLWPRERGSGAGSAPPHLPAPPPAALKWGGLGSRRGAWHLPQREGALCAPACYPGTGVSGCPDGAGTTPALLFG